MKHLEAEQADLVKAKILKGVVDRTQHIILFCAVAFLAFGLYTYPIFSKHMPHLTIWENTWPRFFINTVPFLVLFKVMKNQKLSAESRLTVWSIALPALLHAAAWVNCWPLLLEGYSDVFFTVHTQNTFVLSIWFLYAAPPLRNALIMLATCILFFLLPLIAVVHYGLNEQYVINILLNDIGAAMALNFIVARAAVRLRTRLAIEDIQSKEQTKRLLGGRIAEAIFEKRADLLNGFERPALIIAVDMRGFTRFMIDQAGPVVNDFLAKYHEIITSTSGRYGGFVHKSSGDGHLISFGLMEDHQDLSDVPDIKDKVAQADEMRRRHLFSRADWMILEIVDLLGALKSSSPIFREVRIGAGLSFGPVSVRLIGDKKYRQEFDFHGLPIIEAVRLEAFTKNMFGGDSEAQAIVISTMNFEDDFLQDHHFVRQTLSDFRVRDFEKLDTIISKTYKYQNHHKKDAA